MKLLLLVACVACVGALVMSMRSPAARSVGWVAFDAGNGVSVRFGGDVISVVDGKEHIYVTSDKQWTTSPVTKDGRSFSVRIVDGGGAVFQVHGDPNLNSVRSR